MSLMGTLGKVAVGVMVAKGASKVLGGGGQSSALGGILGSLGGNNSQGGLGELLGKVTGQQQEGGGLSELLGSLGGNNDQGGGLGDLLGKLGGQQEESGGLGGLLGKLGGQEEESGGLGGLLGKLGGNEQEQEEDKGIGLAGVVGGLAGAAGLGSILNQLGGGQSEGGLGDLFNSALQGNEPENVSAEDEDTARLFLRAMISAAKADGHLDDQEQHVITQQLENATPEDIEFVRNELTSPLDLDGLVASVPKGKEQQVYFMSLLGITLDSQEEAQYLDQLAQGMGLSHEVVNQIHQQTGVPEMYS